MLTLVDIETQERVRDKWRCERCGAMLGEVIGQHLIVAHGYRTWVVPITEAGIEARCKCGCDNVLTAERTAA